MSLIFSRIKTYGLALAVAALGAIAVIARLLLAQNSRLRHRAENAEAKAKRAVIIMEADKEIEKAKDKIREERDNHPGFTDPNKLWDRKDDS